jgi:predicted DNA-binding transcriptional regulator AlpA
MDDLLKLIQPIVGLIADEVSKRIKEDYARAIEEEKPQYYDRQEAAELLHISLPTLWSLSNKGKLIPRKIGRRVVYDAKDIKNFMATYCKYGRF